MNTHTARVRPGSLPARLPAVVLAVVLAGAIGWVGASTAHAADDSENGLTVSVPAVSPSTPPPVPPAAVPIANTRSNTTPAAASAPVAGTPSTCTPAEPAVPTQPATTGDEATVDKDVYLVGQEVTATASGFSAGEQVQLVLFSDPVLIGSFTADDTGAVRAAFPVSDTTLPGTHTLQFTGWCDSIAIVDVLIGSSAAGSGSDAQDVPIWAWWVGGALGGLLLVWGGWHVIRTMRVPTVSEAIA